MSLVWSNGALVPYRRQTSTSNNGGVAGSAEEERRSETMEPLAVQGGRLPANPIDGTEQADSATHKLQGLARLAMQ